MLIVLILIGLLILVNGFFASAEMALVTARRTRLKILADKGDQPATKVLAAQDNPSDFLATVQIGITLVATAASAVGGAQIVSALSPYIAQIEGLAPYADEIALTMVILAITYFTLVFGELVPKRLAIENAENLARTFIGPIGLLSRLTYLPMRALAFSADNVLKIISRDSTIHPSTSQEEIVLLVKQGTAEGVIQPVEEKLISGVFDYTDRSVRDVMTPRTSIIALNVETSPTEALKIAKQSGYSRFPVFLSDLDNVVGYVHFKDIIWAMGDTNLRPYTREIDFIPGGATLPKAFDVLTKTGTHMAIALDEYGGTYGLLTLEDLLEEIVGEIEDEHSPITEQLEHPKNGDWIFAGTTPISEVEELLGIDFHPRGEYTTLAGFLLSGLGKIPEAGEQFSKHGYIFTVMEMDRLRIANIHVSQKFLQVKE